VSCLEVVPLEQTTRLRQSGLTVGGAKSDSQLTQSASGTRASAIEAGGNVKLIAAGAGEDSHLTLRGSDVSAAGHATLMAEGDVTLQSQAQSVQQHSTERSSSAGVGLALTYGQGGWAAGFTANASAARGHADGQDLTHRHTEVNAGQSATLVSGRDTTLSGAQVSGEQLTARVGRDLTIHSVQDTATYDSQHRSAGGSVTIGYGFAASASYSNARVEADHASVSQHSGLRAGDQGFQVEVKGHTELQGGLIASTQAAVDEGRNQLATGTLSTQDLTNRSEHEARGISLSGGFSYGGSGKQGSSERAGANSPGSTSAPASPSGGVALQQFQTKSQGVAAGYVSDSSSRASTTRSGISGGEVVITEEAGQMERTGQTAEQTLVAVNRDVLSSTEANGLTQRWDGQKLQQQVRSGAQIVATFGQQASKAVGDYATNKARELRQQNNEEEAQKWDEGGAYRVAAHIAVGGLSGGLEGALGSGSSAAAADALNELTADLPQGVRQAVGAGIAAGLGALTGGPTGASTAFNADVNNRQLHPSEKQLAKDLARQSNGKYTAEQIEEQMRLMGNQALGVAPNTVETLTTPEANAQNALNDPTMPKTVRGAAVMEIPGTANAEIQQFILQNTTDNVATWIPGSSPYQPSRTDLAPAPATGPVVPSAPATASCGNMDLACKSGVGASQIPALTPEQRQAIGTYFGEVSTNYSRMAGLATAAGQPQAALTFEIAAGISATIEQLFSPSVGKVVIDQVGLDLAAKTFSDRTGIPLIMVNEVTELHIKPRLQDARTWVDQQIGGTK
jgi:hypothetical protein